MRAIILGIIVLITISCEAQPRTNIFTGTRWYLSDMDGVLCNECPEMEFNEDGTGKLIRPTGEEIRLNYTILPDTQIKLSFDKKIFFDDGEFLYQIKIENNLEELELKSVNKNSIYLLSREVNKTKDK